MAGVGKGDGSGDMANIGHAQPEAQLKPAPQPRWYREAPRIRRTMRLLLIDDDDIPGAARRGELRLSALETHCRP